MAQRENRTYDYCYLLCLTCLLQVHEKLLDCLLFFQPQSINNLAIFFGKKIRDTLHEERGGGGCGRDKTGVGSGKFAC